LSKKFISNLFHQGGSQESIFEATWPALSPGKDHLSSLPGLKEAETKMLKEAREKAFLIEKEAYEKGFEQGEKDGRELGQKRQEVVIQQMRNVLLEIERQRKDFRQVYENEVLTLLLGIGKRIFRQEVLVCEGLITTVLQEALQYVTDRGRVIVRLHPGDYQNLLAHPGQIPFSLDEKDGIKMVEDPSITRGGCLLETSFGDVDATFEGQFDEIVSQIRQQMKGAERDPGR